MKIISWNVNGIRSVHRKGFLKWFKNSKADIICLQEIKAQKEQLPSNLVNPKGYHSYFSFAEKKGYSGLAVYTKQKPTRIEYQLGLKRFNQEGRFLKLKYPKFTLINLYLPHGGHDKANLKYKLKSYRQIFDNIRKSKDKNIILIGDFNVAHQGIDLARPKQNRGNIMFTPEERKQIDKLIDLGFVDSFRKFNSKGGNYTWWPYGYNARERNVGWRIDYIFVSRKLTSKLKRAFILNKVNMSDHCPIGVGFGF